MGKLAAHSKLNASTMVEVIVAMVILLTVFAMGMFIFSNLFKSTTSVRQLAIRKQLSRIEHDYIHGELSEDYVIIDSVGYTIQYEELIDYPDCIKLKIYAEDLLTDRITDSLISIQVSSSISTNVEEANYE
jgi:hypothetical protein